MVHYKTSTWNKGPEKWTMVGRMINTVLVLIVLASYYCIITVSTTGIGPLHVSFPLKVGGGLYLYKYNMYLNVQHLYCTVQYLLQPAVQVHLYLKRMWVDFNSLFLSLIHLGYVSNGRCHLPYCTVLVHQQL